VEPSVRVGLIGFGTIGTGVVKLLQNNADKLRRDLGFAVEVRRIADLDTTRDRGVHLEPGTLVPDVAAVLDDPSIDIVVELMGGYEPARTFVLQALRSGKDIVTANKAMLAVHGREIFGAAEKVGAELGFEASVGGGIPIIRTLKESLRGDRNRTIYGIVNGTSNYILTRMTEGGGEFADVLRQAQEDGLAEADPRFDVDGIDAAHKLTLLVQLAFGKRVRFDDVPTAGIGDISQLDIELAAELGYVVKPLAIAKDDGERVEARVHPTMVPRRHVLADVGGALNAILVEGEALGTTMYVGSGAGMMPTATAVVADIVAAARNRRGGCRGQIPPLGYPLRDQETARVRPLDLLESEYYLRFMLVDRPGVLSRLTGILGRAGISIASVVQKGREQGGTVPVVMRTHHAREREVRRALRAIDRLPVVRGASTLIRIEESLGT
jgi:homoserine dehydrogenase